MSEAPLPLRRALHLVLESFPTDKMGEIPTPSPDTEVFTLTESTAKEALAKIFAADTVAVWTKL